MNDDDLKRFLRNSLLGRQAPPEARERVLAWLHRRPALRIAFAAAAAVAVCAGFGWMSTRESLPPAIVSALNQHQNCSAAIFGASTSEPPRRELSEVIHDAIGRKVDMPMLRDAGFSALEAHRGETGSAHVVYANHWLKLSCFVFEADKADLYGGARFVQNGVDGEVFTRGVVTAVAIREGGVLKVWVADLRPAQITAIAVDAEDKRRRLEPMMLAMPHSCVARAMEGMLQRIPGVEDVEVMAAQEKAQMQIDPRRVSPDEIVAVLRLNGFEASLRGGEEGR